MAIYKLAILDDYQGIAPSIFSRLPDVEITSFPETLDAGDEGQREKQVKRLQPFHIISTMRERTNFPASVVDQLPNLKLLLITGVRHPGVDMDACRAKGIVVANTTVAGRKRVPGEPTGLDSTTEQTWALILAASRDIVAQHTSIANGGWQMGFATILKGKTLGILGLGYLGSDTARLGVAFGMKVLAWSSNLTQEKADEATEKHGLSKGTFKVAASKKELFEQADVLSVHYVLSDRSKGIVGHEELAAMKPTALLVNTSRGPLIDEKALLDVLRQGKIQGAALDVYDTEPLQPNSPWRTEAWGTKGRSTVILSPHMGYCDESTIRHFYEDSAYNAGEWLKGHKLETQIN